MLSFFPLEKRKSRLKKEERNGSEVPWEAFNSGFDFAKIQCIYQETKADEEDRNTEARKNLLHAAWVLPSVPPTPPSVFPFSQGKVADLASREPEGPYGHQASKVFAERNDKLLINNAIVA